jgi:hypothetical protein
MEGMDAYNIVLQELLRVCKAKRALKVCKGCHEIGHGSNEVKCKLHVENNDKLRKKIKSYILAQDCLSEKAVDEHCAELSVTLGITQNTCKKLYSEIPFEQLLDRVADVRSYVERLKEKTIECSECAKTLLDIQANTNRCWKGNVLCDTCWSKYVDSRNELWDNVKKYKPFICTICGSTRTTKEERFQYDHINMFNKNDSICTLINNGCDKHEVYKELDKCQVLCLACHHIVTEIERRFGFTSLKSNLTKRLKSEEITQEIHDFEAKHLQAIYKVKMDILYQSLRESMRDRLF